MLVLAMSAKENEASTVVSMWCLSSTVGDFSSARSLYQTAVPFIKPEPEEHKILTSRVSENAYSVKTEATQVKPESTGNVRGVRCSRRLLSIQGLTLQF